MTAKSVTSDRSETFNSEGPLRSLSDFPAVPFSGREEKLEELHSLFFEPFYNAAEHIDFDGLKGVRLSARAWRSESSTATLLLVPGRNESHAKYAEVAYDFFTRGYDVFCFDHRGQGFSQRELPRSQVGWVESFQAYVNDLSTFYEQKVEPIRKGPLFVLAHSMGAAVTSLWLSQTRLSPAAVVFSAPMVELVLKPYPRLVVELMVNRALKSGREKDYVLGGKNFQLSTYGFDLTNCRARRDWNRGIFRKYPQTQLGSPSFRWLHEALLMEKRLEHLEFPKFVKCPLLVWQAGQDQVVKNNFVQFAGQSQTSFIVAYEAKAQHELLQETDSIRQRVMCQTLAFFESWKHTAGAD